MNDENKSQIKLFYSYSHRDKEYKAKMDTSLALLKRNQLLKSWSDQSILSGQNISPQIQKNMNNADIVVFLLSQNFIDSSPCMEEWERVKELADEGEPLFRIPIILTACAWKDMLANDDIKALPEDGKPVSEFDAENIAWQQVYEGIKNVISQIRKTFTLKKEFLEEMEKTSFLSQNNINLRDIFVFLPLSFYDLQKNKKQHLEKEITDREQLLKNKFVLIHGKEMSGKTALGRYLFLSLVDKSKPVLHIDLEGPNIKPQERIFETNYNHQFNGDYSLWKQQKDKTLILDNLSAKPNLIDFIVFAKKLFERIIVTLSSDIFFSFFRDEERLADFCEMKINPLTHRKQEELIRKRLDLSDRNKPIKDSYIDQIEKHVNSIIITSKFVPRYPFYVLAILQTYEGYMPSNLPITSYGHCYYVLILSRLIKAGISEEDRDIDSCLNFAEYLAFEIYCAKSSNKKKVDFEKFIETYNKKFIIPNSILNRLKDDNYGIITSSGDFISDYMYYFSLGSFLSKEREKHQKLIKQMSEKIYISSNYLTLLFVIHHTSDSQIIDDILNNTTHTLESVQPAVLNIEETKKFAKIVTALLPESIPSQGSVEEERGRERDTLDMNDDQAENEDEIKQTSDEVSAENPVNDFYRISKNNEILGQILRNKYGSLEKIKIEKIIENISESGLRLVNYILKDEKEMSDYARYLHIKYPGNDFNRIKDMLRFLSFIWTMTNIEKIVSAINHPEIREIVEKIVNQKSTPAYNIIGYFSQLDSAGTLEEVITPLRNFLREHRDPFLKRVLSIRTQHYMNTHRNRASIEQSVCSLLGIKYSPRYKIANSGTLP